MDDDVLWSSGVLRKGEFMMALSFKLALSFVLPLLMEDIHCCLALCFKLTLSFVLAFLT